MPPVDTTDLDRQLIDLPAGDRRAEALRLLAEIDFIPSTKQAAGLLATFAENATAGEPLKPPPRLPSERLLTRQLRQNGEVAEAMQIGLADAGNPRWTAVRDRLRDSPDRVRQLPHVLRTRLGKQGQLIADPTDPPLGRIGDRSGLTNVPLRPVRLPPATKPSGTTAQPEGTGCSPWMVAWLVITVIGSLVRSAGRDSSPPRPEQELKSWMTPQWQEKKALEAERLDRLRRQEFGPPPAVDELPGRLPDSRPADQTNGWQPLEPATEGPASLFDDFDANAGSFLFGESDRTSDLSPLGAEDDILSPRDIVELGSETGPTVTRPGAPRPDFTNLTNRTDPPPPQHPARLTGRIVRVDSESTEVYRGTARQVGGRGASILTLLRGHRFRVSVEDGDWVAADPDRTLWVRRSDVVPDGGVDR